MATTNDVREQLEEAQGTAIEAGKAIGETSRSAMRSYLRAAFNLQRAGLEALEALQKGSENLTYSMLDRAEEMQSRAMHQAEQRLDESVVRLKDARSRIQSRLQEERGELEESGERTEGMLREGVEIGSKVLKVLEMRVETMLTELLDMGRRELGEVEERIEALVNRLDRELEEEIRPIANYDEKNVDEITSELADLDSMQLSTIRTYEVNHKNRVTILRAIDEKLAERDELSPAASKSFIDRVEEGVERVSRRAARVEEEVEKRAVDLVNPINDYDGMNVEEVKAELGGLNVAQLGMVRAYEVARKERVMVLRAIDEELEARAEKVLA